MRRARRPRMLGATTKAMPVSIVEEERRRRRGPDRTRALRGSAIGLPPRRRPQGWRACVSPLMRAHVSGPPADVAVFMATSTKLCVLLHRLRERDRQPVGVDEDRQPDPFPLAHG